MAHRKGEEQMVYKIRINNLNNLKNFMQRVLNEGYEKKLNPPQVKALVDGCRVMHDILYSQTIEAQVAAMESQHGEGATYGETRYTEPLRQIKGGKEAGAGFSK